MFLINFCQQLCHVYVIFRFCSMKLLFFFNKKNMNHWRWYFILYNIFLWFWIFLLNFFKKMFIFLIWKKYTVVYFLRFKWIDGCCVCVVILFSISVFLYGISKKILCLCFFLSFLNYIVGLFLNIFMYIFFLWFF